MCIRDRNDPVPLTPGHFLICAPLTAIPDPDLSHVPISRLGRWQLLQKFVQVIWKSWSRDYLHQLQQRHKWKFAKENVSIGDLVLLLSLIHIWQHSRMAALLLNIPRLATCQI